MNDLQRFLEKVTIKGPADCWLWIGAISSNGRIGSFWLDGKNVNAHRAAYLLQTGPILNNLCVLHKCDVSLCMNPAHLFLGTQADNMADMDQKGRRVNPIGVNHGSNKLTEEQVNEILRLRTQTKMTLKAIAKLFSVSDMTIHHITTNATWKHI